MRSGYTIQYIGDYHHPSMEALFTTQYNGMANSFEHCACGYHADIMGWGKLTQMWKTRGFPFGTWSSDLLFHGGKKPHRTWSKYVKILLPTVTPLVEDVSWDLHKLRNATSALRQNHGAVAAVLHREDHPVPEWSHQVASGTNGYD